MCKEILDKEILRQKEWTRCKEKMLDLLDEVEGEVAGFGDYEYLRGVQAAIRKVEEEL